MRAGTVETEVIEDAVLSACRAPSLHNSQPWRWLFSGGELRLFLDPSRVTDTDQSAREALIGCGATLDHVRVATAAAGWHANVDRFPDPTNSNHLASIQFSPLDSVTERDRLRAKAIWARRSDRLPFTGPTDWTKFEPVVTHRVSDFAVRLAVLADDLRPRIVQAAQIAESLRFYDIPYKNELNWWTAPFEASEGIPYSALVSSAENDRVGMDRVFPATHQPERRIQVPQDHAKILLLTTDDDSHAAALASGEALSEVLLECTLAGLATCPVTHLTEVHVTRDLIRSLIEYDAVPQVLIRVGVAPVTEKAPPPTPRRPLSDVLRFDS